MTLEELENIDDGWVEWPTFPENEQKFDWSLSYEEIDKRYGGVKKKYNKVNYTSRTSLPYSIGTNREREIKLAHYVNYMGKDCPCVGFIDRAYSRMGLLGVRQYQNAYYHAGEEKYLFEIHDGILAYSKEDVGKFIKPFFPNQDKKLPTIHEINKAAKKKSIPNWLKQLGADATLSVNTNTSMTDQFLAEPEPDFHY